MPRVFHCLVAKTAPFLAALLRSKLDAEDIMDERHKHYIILDVATQVPRTHPIIEQRCATVHAANTECPPT